LLRKLNREKKLKAVDTDAINRFENALSHPEALQAVRGKCALLHGDLKCDNMIIRPHGGLVIIDWQSVLYGPEHIDIYNLLAFEALNPVPIAGIGPEILRLALAIRWFAICLDRWMPRADFFDKLILKIENHIRHIVEYNGYVGMEVYYFH
jgi:aminoglycoside phosphotransferase (APT) family kinase protein